MKLSEKDAELFFDLMWGLQYFVNQKLKIINNIQSLEDYVMCSTEKKFEVRTALYSDIKIIYGSNNPLDLSLKGNKLSFISVIF